MHFDYNDVAFLCYASEITSWCVEVVAEVDERRRQTLDADDFANGVETGSTGVRIIIIILIGEIKQAV